MSSLTSGKIGLNPDDALFSAKIAKNLLCFQDNMGLLVCPRHSVSTHGELRSVADANPFVIRSCCIAKIKIKPLSFHAIGK